MSVRNSIRDAIRSAIGLVEEVFNPQTLFLSGEQGVWYDPSDTSTLFQDSAGTTPVTASGQPVGRMLDKSGRGNHATQPTAGSRPIYRRGDSRGVVNLLRWSEDFSNAAWQKSNTTVLPNHESSPYGLVSKHVVDNSSAYTTTVQVVVLRGATPYRISALVKAEGSNYITAGVIVNDLNYAAAQFDLAAGIVARVASTGGGGAYKAYSAEITPQLDGYYLCSVTVEVPITLSIYTGAWVDSSVWVSGRPDRTQAGDGASGVLFAYSQLETGPTALPYQRNDANLGGVATGASTDLHWLATDGVDDGMVTGNIDFTGTDKVSVFAGVRKLSDAARGMVVELGNNQVNGVIVDTRFDASHGYRLVAVSAGNENPAAIASPVIYAAPNTAVLAGRLDRGAATLALQAGLRINGSSSSVNLAGSAAPAANLISAPIYLFRRGGTTLPFNGWFYGLAITGRLTTDAETVATERFLAAKSAVVIP